MNNLYSELSGLYDSMYQTFIDYKEEFEFYNSILAKHNCRSVIEIGCGSANLAAQFVSHGIEYTGVDMSGDMLKIARQRNPECLFIEADMRNFSLTNRTDACIITGRTLSYLIANKDVYSAFNAINNALDLSGVLCFDCIDANKFIPLIDCDKEIVHKAFVNGKQFQRSSIWNINFNQSWTFDWTSIFYSEEKNGSLKKIGEDQSTIRSFSKNEITLFMELAGFNVIEIIDRPSYAFDTFVFVAEKVRQLVKV